MKKLSLYTIVAVFFGLTAILLSGCDSGESDISSTADIGYDGFKSDVELFYEFVYRKESLLLNMLNYTSDGFTKAPFEGTVTNDEYVKFFLELEEINKNSEKYIQAAQKLEQSGVLQRPTHTRGLFSSVTGFVSWMSGSGQRRRDNIVTIASNMSADDRTKLYNDLRPEWKNKTTGEADFWNKLQKGDFDSSAAQMMNDFNNNGETEFPYLAQEKGLTPHKIVVDEGAKGIETGAGMMLDGASTLVPGFGTGMTVISVADNVEKMVKSETWKEAAEHGFHAATDILEEIGGDYGSTIFNASDVVAAIKDKVDHLVFSEGDKQETKGKVTVKDKNKESKQPIVITEKKGGGTNDSSPSIYITGKDFISKGVDLFVKGGNWLVTIINGDGFRETVEVKVEPGKVTVVEVDTGEPKKDEEPKGGFNTKLLTYVEQCYIEITGTHPYGMYEGEYSTSLSNTSEFFGENCSVYPKGSYRNNVFSANYNKICHHEVDIYGSMTLSGSIQLTFDESKQVITLGECLLKKEVVDSESESTITCSFKLRDIPFTVTDDNIEIKYKGEIGKEVYDVYHQYAFTHEYGSGEDYFTSMKEVSLTIRFKEKMD